MGPTWSLWTKVFGSYVGDPYGPHLGAHMGPMWDPVGRVDRVQATLSYLQGSYYHTALLPA